MYHDDDNMDSENSPLISEAKQSSKEKSDGKNISNNSGHIASGFG